MHNLIKQKIHALECQLAASKGGNVPGITEDHRYEMVNCLQALRLVLRDSDARKAA